MDGLLGFILAGLALAGSLGYMAGIVIGMVGVMGIAAAGAISVVLAIPGAKPAVIGAAAAYFAYLAYRIATAPPLAEGASTGRRPSFAGGLFLSLVNPKGYAAMAALFSGFVLVRERLELDAATKTVVLTATIIAVNTAWL